MPDIPFPNIDSLPNFDFEKAAADLNNALKEVAYVAVGLGVLGFQRAQVQRVELMKQLEAQLSALSSFSGTLGEQAETYLAAVRTQLAEVLPSEPVDTAAVRSQLTELAKAVDEAVAPVRQQFEEQLDRLEDVLPQTARELVQTVRGAAAAQEQAVRSAVGLS